MPVWEQTRIFCKLNSFPLLSSCFQTVAVEIEYWRQSRIVTIIGLWPSLHCSIRPNLVLVRPWHSSCLQITQRARSTLANEAIVDSRLCHQHAKHDEYLPVFVAEQNSAGIHAGVGCYAFAILRTCHRVTEWKYDVIHKTGSTYGNVSKRRQRKTEPPPQATCIK